MTYTTPPLEGLIVPDNAPAHPVWDATTSEWVDFYSRAVISAHFTPENMEGIWRNEYLDLVVDPADTPDYVPSEGAFWDRVKGQWMYDETTQAYSIRYDKT